MVKRNMIIMMYKLISATDKDIQYLKEAKLYSIFQYAHNLNDNEITKIHNYVNNYIPMQIKNII